MILSLCPHCQHHGNKEKMVRYGSRFYHKICRAEVYVEHQKKQAIRNYKPTLKDRILFNLFGVQAKVYYTV